MNTTSNWLWPHFPGHNDRMVLLQPQTPASQCIGFKIFLKDHGFLNPPMHIQEILGNRVRILKYSTNNKAEKAFSSLAQRAFNPHKISFHRSFFIIQILFADSMVTLGWRGWDDNACLGVRNTSSIGAWPNSLDRRPPWYCIVSPLLQTNKQTNKLAPPFRASRALGSKMFVTLFQTP